LEHHANPHPHFNRINSLAHNISAAGVQDDFAIVARTGIQVVNSIETTQQRAFSATGGAD
jgi:hypothetical protein